jgi:hypothetical protein
MKTGSLSVLDREGWQAMTFAMLFEVIRKSGNHLTNAGGIKGTQKLKGKSPKIHPRG